MVVIGNYTRGRGISNLSNKSNLPSINVVGYSLASAYPSYAKGFGGDSMQALPDIKLNPWFVTGFADAESSFTMSVFKSKTAAIGWTIEPCFIITLHIKDIELLNKIQLFFVPKKSSIFKTQGQGLWFWILRPRSKALALDRRAEGV